MEVKFQTAPNCSLPSILALNVCPKSKKKKEKKSEISVHSITWSVSLGHSDLKGQSSITKKNYDCFILEEGQRSVLTNKVHKNDL